MYSTGQCSVLQQKLSKVKLFLQVIPAFSPPAAPLNWLLSNKWEGCVFFSLRQQTLINLLTGGGGNQQTHWLNTYLESVFIWTEFFWHFAVDVESSSHSLTHGNGCPFRLTKTPGADTSRLFLLACKDKIISEICQYKTDFCNIPGLVQKPSYENLDR